MNYTLVVLFSFSIAISAIIGLVRFKKINPAYYPFLFCIWLGLLNEIVSYFIARRFGNNSANNNVYFLCESLLIVWQFKKWRTFENARPLYFVLLGLFICSWCVDSFLLSSLNSTIHYFPILYSFIIVLLSIHTINGLIVRERKNILKNPVFLICVGLVFYFTLRVLTQTFWLYGNSLSLQFRINVAYTLIYVNLFSNLIYALAVLWIPKKQRFTLPS